MAILLHGRVDMTGRRKIEVSSDSGAPNGEKTSLDGSEYFPISGSQVAKISSIGTYIAPIDSDSTHFLDGNRQFNSVKDSYLSLSDITTNNADSDHHGFLPKLSGDSDTYIDGKGTWGNPTIPFAQYSSSDEVTIANAGSDIVPISTETIDDYGIGVLVDSDDKVTLVEAGWYSIEAVVGHYSNGSDYNGTIFVGFAAGIDNTGETRGYVTAWAISSDELEIAVPIFHATVDNTSYVQISIVNNSGQSIQGYLNRLSIKRLRKD